MSPPFAKTLAALGLAGSLAMGFASASSAAPSAVAPHGSGPQWGINIWVGYQCEPTSTWETWGRSLLSQIKALHANTVGFTFPFYTDGHTANTYYAKQQCGTEYSTPTPSELGELVDIAHADGLKVFLRPYLYAGDMHKINGKWWAGNIAPTNPQTWFANYTNTLKPYLSMAQAHSVEHFAISTEMSSMTGYSYWSLAIEEARIIYKGQLVFTHTWQNSPNKKVWPGTSAGIDTYPYLSQLKPTSTVHQIVVAWNGELRKYPIPGNLTHWTDDETGIPAQNGAYGSPNITNLPLSRYPFNPQIQANWFTAACQFVKTHHMGGLYYSTVVIYQGALLTKPDPSVTFELQPQGLAAIKACFA